MKATATTGVIRDGTQGSCSCARSWIYASVTNPTELQDSLQGAFAGTYRLERELGGGGMSSIFVATEVALGRRVVVKVLPPEMRGAVNADRFRREVQLAAQLQNAHIVPLLSAGEVNGLLYYTMPFVEGETLRTLLTRGGLLPVGETAGILRDILKALSYAHKRSIVHRDIKPENILLTEHDALVVDFGIAKALVESATSTSRTGLTSAGIALGTPAYMSPEQAAADPEVDQRSDLYALGVVAYEMLAGSHPFLGRTPSSVLAAHIAENPQPLAPRRPEIPAELAQIVMGLLEKAPADRPRTADDVLRALDEATAVAGRDAATTNERSKAAPAQRQSIAVLPFANVGGDPSAEYFSDGMTEELINALAKIDAIRVAARTSSFAFKGKDVDAREVGVKLGVATILEGSVRRSGSRLRVSAQLVGCGDGYQVWSETYDRQMDDVFDVQDDIARAIVSALRVRFEGEAPKRIVGSPTNDLVAYDLYLKGRFAVNQRTGQSAAEAARWLEQAVARDPQFARAHAALVDAYVIMPLYTGASPRETWPKAKEAGARALRLDATLADAHASLAYGTMLNEWDWPRAEAGFRNAIAADPDYPTAHHWYADFLAGQGRLEESLVEMRRAHELDPLSLIIATELGWVLYLLHRSDEALAQLEQNLALDQNYAHTHFVLGLTLLEKREYDASIASLQKGHALGGFYSFAFAAQAQAHAFAGNRDAALDVLGELQSRSEREYIPPFALAIAQTGLGDKTTAFESLNRGVDERDFLLAENFFDPVFDSLRTDERYAPLLKRMGISDPRTPASIERHA